MKTILVATDFSACSINAAEYAVELALSINAEIHLFHSYEIPVGAAEVPAAFDFEAMEKSAANDMNTLIERLLLKSSGKIKISNTISIGSFISEIKETIQIVKPYFIVIGSQGATIAERVLFGSNALSAITHLECPLIVVPNKTQFKAIKKIAVASDLKDVIHTMPVDKLNELINLFQCELHIINVKEENKFDPETVFQSSLLEELMLDKKPYYHFLAGEDIDSEILEFANKNEIDMIMLFPKRHSLVQKILHKSHSKQAALHSRLPLLFMHHE